MAKQPQRGFTVIELMIATTIFSLVLMVALAGILQITKMYYRGVTTIRVQEAARAISDEIGEAIRFSASSVNLARMANGGPEFSNGSSDNRGYFCIGSKRFSFVIDRQVADINVESESRRRHALWVDQPTTCAEPSANFLEQETPSAGGREMLAKGMRLSRLQVTELAGLPGVYTIEVGVIFGDNDLIQTAGLYRSCRLSFAGSEFCALSNLSTTVQRRIQ